jgi:hypothetical protein
MRVPFHPDTGGRATLVILAGSVGLGVQIDDSRTRDDYEYVWQHYTCSSVGLVSLDVARRGTGVEVSTLADSKQAYE